MAPSIINSLLGPKGYLRRPRIFWAFVVLAGMIISFCLDRPVLDLTRWLNPEGLPGDAVRNLQSFKEFGQPLAIVVGCLLILVLDRNRRKMLPRLIICVLLSLAVWPLKLTVNRLRPRHIEPYNTTLGLGFFTGERPPLFPLAGPLSGQDKIVLSEKISASMRQSFPSGHTATAFAFAVGLAALYPPARVIFYALAAGCGLHRIIFDAHWLSDVVAGLFIGLLIARAIWHWPPAKNKATAIAKTSPHA